MLFAMSCVSYIQNEQMIAVKYACLPLQGFLASKGSSNDFFSQANIHLHVPEVDPTELTGIKRRRQIGCPVCEVLEATLHLFNPHFSAFHA